MGVAFEPGVELGRGDLDIFLSNAAGNAANSAEIYYAIYYVDPGPPETEVLIGSANRTPVNPAVGEYYASVMIPASANLGDYRIRWTFRELSGSPQQQVVQEFAVIQTGSVVASSFTSAQQEMIDKLRILVRDNNPDKNYHFRPPEGEGTIGCYNAVFGYIWEDAELLEYIERALDTWNMMPPETEALSTVDKLVQLKPAWRTPILWGAIIHAATALVANWTADEFDYSIGGISLSIEKSSKYDSLRQAAETQFDKATEAKVRTTKFMRGLRQPRFGIGVRSAFGPFVGRGVLSPRNFV